MQKGRNHSDSIRHLLVATSALCVLAGASAPAAFADLSLAGVTEALPAGAPVAQVVAEAAKPVVETTVTPTAPVVKQVTDTAGPVKTAAQAAPPVVAPLIDAIAPALDATTPVPGLAQPDVETAAPVVTVEAEAATPATKSAAPAIAREEAPRPAAPATGTTPSERAVAAEQVIRDTLPAVPSDVSTRKRATHRTPTDNAAPAAGGSPVIALPNPRVGDLGIAPPNRTRTQAAVPRAPLPDTPSGQPNDLASAFASAGGGALTTLLAALAAALFLAAPGLGRRLRSTLAPWPRPLHQLSLERPG